MYWDYQSQYRHKYISCTCEYWVFASICTCSARKYSQIRIFVNIHKYSYPKTNMNTSIRSCTFANTYLFHTLKRCTICTIEGILYANVISIHHHHHLFHFPIELWWHSQSSNIGSFKGDNGPIQWVYQHQLLPRCWQGNF